MEFQVGDQVVLTGTLAGDQEDILPEGTTGTIVHITDNTWPPIGVCWDVKPEDGHDCMHHCEYGYGWFVCEDEIAVIADDDMDDVPDISSLL